MWVEALGNDRWVGVTVGAGVWSYSDMAGPKLLSSQVQTRPSQSQGIRKHSILEVDMLKRIIKVDTYFFK